MKLLIVSTCILGSGGCDLKCETVPQQVCDNVDGDSVGCRFEYQEVCESVCKQCQVIPVQICDNVDGDSVGCRFEYREVCE